MNKTPIQWTTFSANPLKYRTADGRVVWACEKLSGGCTNCYAEALSHRYGGARRAGDWNAATMATLTPFLDEAELHKMRTAKTIGGVSVAGSRCFLGDMTDIFGDWVSDDLLNRLFSQTLELRTDVTWQILTKRAERMQKYLSWRWGGGRIPSRHIHIGVSVEDQPTYDQRIGHLLRTPAAVRFLSVEPMLSGIDMRMGGMSMPEYAPHNPLPDINWCIVGGESGRQARPFDVVWARSIVQQCHAAGVAVFVKQFGANPFDSERTACQFDSYEQWVNKARSWLGGISSGGVRYKDVEHVVCVDARGRLCSIGRDFMRARDEGTFPVRACQAIDLRDSHGGDMAEWPADLRVRQFPEVARG